MSVVVIVVVVVVAVIVVIAVVVVVKLKNHFDDCSIENVVVKPWSANADRWKGNLSDRQT